MEKGCTWDRRAVAKYQSAHKGEISAKAKARRDANLEDARATERSFAKKYQTKRTEYMREWRAENPDKVKQANAASRARNPEKHRDYILRSSFGITLAEYRAMLDRQNGVCAVCFRPETILHRSRYGATGKTRSLAVDHDHATGKVRGLLCSHCNKALGALMDSVEVIDRLKAYLLKARQ